MKRIHLSATLFLNLILLSAGFLLLGAGCATKLEEGGAYNGDKWLYRADETAITAYEMIHTFVTWEHQNRAEVQKTFPDITKHADFLREHAPDWWAKYQDGRDTYLKARAVAGAAGSTVQFANAKRELADRVMALGSNANIASSMTSSAGQSLPNAPNLKPVPTLEAQ